MKIYVVTPNKNRLGETVLLRGHNLCFYGKIRKIIPKLSLLLLLIHMWQLQLKLVTHVLIRIFACIRVHSVKPEISLVCCENTTPTLSPFSTLRLRPDFTSHLVHVLAFGTPKFYIAPYDKIKHELVNLSSNCDVKSGLSLHSVLLL